MQHISWEDHCIIVGHHAEAQRILFNRGGYALHSSAFTDVATSFEWAQHLRLALDHFNVHGMNNEEKSICVKYAGGISDFIDVFSSYDIVEERVREVNVLNFIVEY